MEYLPAELTIDILSRLPVKTIVYCKCVCKKWRNLVMDSSFIDLHLSRSPTAIIIHHSHRPPDIIDSNVSNILYKAPINDPGILEWVEIQDKDDYHHLHYDPLMSLRLNLTPIFQNSLTNLEGSVNGLICLTQSGPYFDNTYVCNPITREYMILPRQNCYRKDGKVMVYGFGVSSMTGEYKVIRTFQISHTSDILEAEVYTLGTCQWRSLGRVPYGIYLSYDGPFLNDHCHWIVCEKKYTPEKLFTFDFENETFQLFPSPPVVEDIQGFFRYPPKHLTILKGCLCKTDFYGSHFTMWVMKEYGIKESWHKELVIKQAISPGLDWPMSEPLILIAGLKDGSILTLSEYKLWTFYPNNKTIQDTGLFEFFSTVRGLPYHPSFVKLQNFELESVHMF